MTRKSLLILILLACTTGCPADTTSDTFQVSAVISSGCALGSSSNSTTDFGTISFGTMSAISANVDVASSAGAGSLILTCTPGTSITIALDYGVNGGSSSQRYLVNSSGATLAYQLYQDASYSTVWGNGTLAYSVSSFPATTQTYTVYARLFAVDGLPAAGNYSDTVTVTLTY